MPKLYHSPQSRSSNILSLLRAMGKETEVEIEIVDIQRQNGQGRKDPRNPHPEGKVPVLEVDGRLIRESGAIMLWLTDHFDSPLGRGLSDPERAEYLSWLFYYGNVIEPVLYLGFLDLGDNPMLISWCRDKATMMATLETALAASDFLIGDRFSAADLLVSSPFQWMPNLLPESGVVRDWYDRCLAAQDMDYIKAFDTDSMAQLGLSGG